MVNLPIPSDIPGLDSATVDIAAVLRSMPDVNCGSILRKAVYIVVIAKPKDTQLPLYVPVAGATIESRQILYGIETERKTGYANTNGIHWICVPIPLFNVIQFRVKQYNVDFGNGTSQFTDWKRVSEISVIKGDIDLPCTGNITAKVPPISEIVSSLRNIPPELSIPILAKNSQNIPIPVNILVDGKVINSNVKTESIDIVDILQKADSFSGTTGYEIKIEPAASNCNISSVSFRIPSFAQTLPTLPCTGNFTKPNMSSLLSGITTPPSSLTVPVGLPANKTSIPVDIFVGGTRVATEQNFTGEFDLIHILSSYYSILGTAPDFTSPLTVTIKSKATDCKIPDLPIYIPPIVKAKLCSLPKIFNPLTGDCETPAVGKSECLKYITVAEQAPSHPSEITDFNSTFYVYIHKMKSACESDPTNPAFISSLPKGTPGTVTLGNLSSVFYLDDGGIVNLDLARDLGFDLKSLAGFKGGSAAQPAAVQEIVEKVAQTIKSVSCNITGRFRDTGTTAAAVQALLPSGYSAESASFGGAGTFKITRPNGSYFYAQSCDDINRLK